MSGVHVDIRQLTYFLGVIDHGGFSRAADALHVAQPSLSQSIRSLERRLGVELFHRTGRRAELTSAGERLVLPARQVLRDLDVARRAVSSVRALESGTVELAAMPSPGVEPLTGLIRDFHARYPGMMVNVAGVFTPSETVEAVRSGTAEIGLLGSSGQPQTADLDVCQLESQPLVLISPPGTETDSETIERRSLNGLRFVISPRGSLMRQLIDNALVHDSATSVIAEMEHRTSLLPLVRSGIGHTVMPDSWREIAQSSGCVVRRIVPEVNLDIFAVSRRGELTPGGQALMALIHSRALGSHTVSDSSSKT
ncbi:LysR family transcriptional regulator [Corynebacterium suranareeae]|uniref:LysR family transcriptional regulator n=1 Tax=Corynebacterium suranareeae TaxID=2506452 RepID=A0A160PUF8_9CORY|nr:LysR family transcriptional regulator [Corynebacterium glutamicum]BAU96220.1 LysR family transcriptional regulator [Corynebacterium suranareeae]